MFLNFIPDRRSPKTCMWTATLFDTTGVNDRQLVKLCSVCYGIHPQIHIVDQTNQCDAKSNKYRITHLEWSAVHEQKYS